MPAYDVVVVGSGSAGTGVAHACASAGLKVAVVDKHPFGGTCALRGCDPKKVLFNVTEAAHRARSFDGLGLRASDVQVDWAKLQEFKRSFTDPVPDSRRQSLQKAGIETHHGVARFTARDTLSVGDATLQSEHVVLAAGAKPRPLAFEGADHVIDSTDFLALHELPPRVAFIGGGYISLEFAHMCARAGRQATILHRSGRVLPPFDEDLTRQLETHTRDIGIDLRLDTEVLRVEQRGKELQVVARNEGEGEVNVPCDLVVHGAGRVPDLDDLDLEAAGVERGRHGVKVDEHLRSASNRHVWACGDAAETGPPLTPVASVDGRTVGYNILHPDAPRRPDYSGVPSVVFTTIPLAVVGMTEQEARAQGLSPKVNTANTSGWASSRRLHESGTRYKVLVDPETDLILGAHLLLPHADEVINLFALAVRHKITATQLRHSMFAYPTGGSDIAYMV